MQTKCLLWACSKRLISNLRRLPKRFWKCATWWGKSKTSWVKALTSCGNAQALEAVGVSAMLQRYSLDQLISGSNNSGIFSRNQPWTGHNSISEELRLAMASKDVRLILALLLIWGWGLIAQSQKSTKRNRLFSAGITWTKATFRTSLKVFKVYLIPLKRSSSE